MVFDTIAEGLEDTKRLYGTYSPQYRIHEQLEKAREILMNKKMVTFGKDSETDLHTITFRMGMRRDGTEDVSLMEIKHWIKPNVNPVKDRKTKIHVGVDYLLQHDIYNILYTRGYKIIE